MRKSTELSKDYLESYLTRRCGGRAVRVASIVKFPRGMSRETWFVQCTETAPDFPRAMILRRDLPTMSVVPTSLRFEYEIYRRLQDSRVPVPRTFGFEEDAALLPDDRPFYLREQIDGDWDDPGYLNPDAQFDATRIAMSREHVRNLALVHTSDWKALGFATIMREPKSAADCARTSIERYFDILSGYQIEPLPILTEAREWLLDNAPVAPRISLLKGTNGRGEEVFRDGKIVAMCDWEQAALGDPASDFARCQDFLNDVVRDGKKLWGLEQALAYYEEVAGIHVPPASVEYYRVLNCLENAVCVHHCAKPLADGSDRLARLVWLTTEVLHYAQMMLLGAVTRRQIDAALAFSTQTAKVAD
jgi:aminoglycoside phosphotransferase (APT) family kinase protein